MAEFQALLTTTLPLAVPVLIAVGGWIFTHAQTRASASRTARLSRVNQQLRQLYGPLNALLESSDAAWGAFTSACWPKHGQAAYFAKGFETTDDEKAHWRLWMREVFHPMNARMERVITDNLDLVEGGEMPKAFVDVLAHIAAYHTVLRKWDAGDYTEHTSIINFPGAELKAVVKPVYDRLLREQTLLIAATQTRR